MRGFHNLVNIQREKCKMIKRELIGGMVEGKTKETLKNDYKITANARH